MAWSYYELSGGADFVPERREPAFQLDAAVAAITTPPQRSAEAEGDAARAAALAEVTAADPAATIAPQTGQPQTVAAPVFTSLAQRRENLAAIAAAEAAARTQTTLRPAAEAGADLRVVDGSRVNLRDGPGTNFVAIDQLTRGTVTEVLEYGPGNWVRVQVQGSTQSGWMSSNFLVTVN